MSKILVLDDEKDIADLIALYLINDHHEVDVFYDSEEAIKQIKNIEYDLAILDIMMPKIDGLKVCQYIREQYLYPVIMLTAKGEDLDKIHGLMIGADDYITKPFNPLVVCARVKAQLRRYTTYDRKSEENNSFLVQVRDLQIDVSRHTAILNGEMLNLTPKEFAILLDLCEHKGSVVSSEELFERVWKEKYYEGNNTVMVHIRRIREKMKEPSQSPAYIKTVWGIGYCIDE